MTTDDEIRDEKLQYDINRETAKISTLSSGKIYKCKYLTGKEISSSNQRQIIEQAKFAYSPLGKAFEKQTEKQFAVINSLDFPNKNYELQQVQGIFPQNQMIDLIFDKLKETVNLRDIKTDNLHYKSKNRKVYNFREYSLRIVF